MLIGWCHYKGIVRYEVNFKQRFLTQNNLTDWHVCNTKNIREFYKTERKQVVRRIEVDTTLDKLTLRAKGIYHAYLAGEDFSNLPKSTFYRFRRELLGVGIDISMPPPVIPFKGKFEVIQMKPAAQPEFYNLPKVA